MINQTASFFPKFGAALLLLALAAGCGDGGSGGDPSKRREVEPNERPADIELHNNYGDPSGIRQFVGQLSYPDDQVDVYRFSAPRSGLKAETYGYLGLEPGIFLREVDERGYPLQSTSTYETADMIGSVQITIEAALKPGATYDLGVVCNNTTGSYRVFLSWFNNQP